MMNLILTRLNFLFKVLLLTCSFYLFSQSANACDNGSMTLVSAVDNGDGTFTYTLNLEVELGGFDASYYGFVLQFNSSLSTPTVTGFPSQITSSDVTTSTSFSTLTGLVGSDVNSVAVDSDWNKYDNTTNVVSYEYGGFGGSTSDDFSLTIAITVDGCVEDILFDSHVNGNTSGSCSYTVNVGSCAVCNATITPSADDICEGNTTNLTSGITNVGTNPVYLWESSDFTITNASASSASINVPDPTTAGIYTISLTYTDDEGCNLLATTTFEVFDGASPTCGCTADVGTVTVTGTGVFDIGGGVYEVNDGETINFTTSGEDLNGGALTYGWAVFDCDPGLPLSAGELADLTTHPCYIGSDYGNSTSDINAGGISNSIGIDPVYILPYTSDVSNAVDNDGDGCYDVGTVIEVNYLDPSCGDCSNPNCGIAQVATFADRTDGYFGGPSADCNVLGSPITNTTYVTYHTATTDANGNLGIVQQADDGGCVTRTAVLRALSGGACTGGDISPDDSNANGLGSGFNPEWYSLTPNTDYAVIITVVVPSGCFYGQGCTVAYGIPNPCTASVGSINVTGGGVTNIGADTYELDAGSTINFSATGEDLNGGALTYGWAVFDCDPGLPFSAGELADLTTHPCYIGSDYGTTTSDDNVGGVSSTIGTDPVWIVAYTSDVAGAVDNDGDGCYAVGNAIEINYLDPTGCGDCSNPNCGIAEVLTYDDRTDGYEFGPDEQCNFLGSSITNTTYITYHTATTDANGNIGLVQQTDASCITRTAVLRALSGGSCTGSDIDPDVTNANGVGSGFNPEWYGLTPNTAYAVIITTTIPAGCNYSQGCAVAYGIPTFGCGDCASPTCPIAGPYVDYPTADIDGNEFSNCEVIGTPDGFGGYIPGTGVTTSPYVSYHSVTASSDGNLGLITSALMGGGAGCSVTKTAVLYEVGTGCASPIAADVNNANSSPYGYNPEWYGLTANGNYVLEITFTFDDTNCELFDHCDAYYQPVDACNASVGNVSVTGTGLTSLGGNVYDLNDGGTIDFSTSGENLDGSLTYGWAVFDCDPGLPLSAAELNNLFNHPCYLGSDYGLTTNDFNNAGGSGTIGGLDPIFVLPYTSDVANAVDNDGDGCYDIGDVITINYLECNLTLNPSATDVSCNGLSDGSASVAVSGGAAPYSYSWSNGASGVVASNLAAGVYTVTITDNNSCEDQASVTISEPQAMNAVLTKTDASCGNSNGTASVSASGGDSSYSYSWSNGSTISTTSGLSAGPVSVTVTDGNGCAATSSDMINNPSPSLTVTSSGSLSCFGDADGTVSAIISGGNSPITYTWSNGETTASITGLSGGTYSVTVEDNSSCLTFGNGAIVEPAALSLTVTSTNIDCNGSNNGTATAVGGGGVGTIDYTWGHGPTTGSVSSLSAAVYTVTINDDNNCTETSSITITEPSALNISVSSNDISCFGENDGEGFAFASGGVPSYQYSWSNGVSGNTVTALGVGNYTVSVTDNNGCVSTDVITINEPNELAVTLTSVEETCGASDGEVHSTVNGGSGTNYTYNWSNAETDASITGLTAGIYSLTVTDNSGCKASETIFVSNDNPQITVSPSYSLDCNGDNDGTASVVASGGLTPYSYNWSSGQTTDNISNMTDGTYFVSVSDQNGCIKQGSIVISEPSKISAFATIDNVSCGGQSDGAITLVMSGGTTAYSFNWSNGASSQDLTSIAGGSYLLTITDANGCTLTKNYIVNEPSPIQVTQFVNQVSCFGESDGVTIAQVSGGSTPYNYAWSNGGNTNNSNGLPVGNYTVTVTDNNACSTTSNFTLTQPSALTVSTTVTTPGCNGGTDGFVNTAVQGGTSGYTYNWNNGETTSDITGLGLGIYTLSVTDVNNCVSVAAVSVTQPESLAITVTASDASCFGENSGSLFTTVTGGITPYSYTWNNGSTTSSQTGVAAGVYNLTVADGNNCANAAIGYVLQPTALSVTLSGTDASCNGGGSDGAISSTVIGGTTAYSYAWNNGSTTSSLSSLNGGTYTLTVTDGNGCVSVEVVTIQQATQADISISANQFVCQLANSFVITATPAGGTWTASSNFNATTGDYSPNLVIAEYVVYEIPGACGDKDSMLVEVFDLPTINYTSTPESFNGAMDGSLTVVGTNGSSPYSFVWDTGELDSLRQNLEAGNYQLTITDANGCQTDTVAIVELVPSASHVYVPNIFTPNGDNNNDVLKVFGYDVDDVVFRIFNRWGEVVFETNTIPDEWDGTYKGKLMNSGVFVYTLTATLSDGSEFSESGNITLIR